MCEDQHLTIDVRNAWDDTLLIKAYHGSVHSAKAELATRLAFSSNKYNAAFNSLIVKKSCHKQFQEGDYVRATYIDGADYEAKIVSLKKNGICLLKYIGFNNVQEAFLSDLVSSWGKRARRYQFSQAQINFRTGKQSETKKDNSNFRKLSLGFYPPKPPLPLISRKEGGCEQLAAMVMAWYMSGYYTGVYECSQMNEGVGII